VRAGESGPLGEPCAVTASRAVASSESRWREREESARHHEPRRQLHKDTHCTPAPEIRTCTVTRVDDSRSPSVCTPPAAAPRHGRCLTDRSVAHEENEPFTSSPIWAPGPSPAFARFGLKHQLNVLAEQLNCAGAWLSLGRAAHLRAYTPQATLGDFPPPPADALSGERGDGHRPLSGAAQWLGQYEHQSSSPKRLPRIYVGISVGLQRRPASRASYAKCPLRGGVRGQAAGLLKPVGPALRHA
jgi:hypothetical protein